jgi:hypothetical protein
MAAGDLLTGAIEGALMGWLASYVVASIAGQDDESEEKARPFYVGGGAFLGALKKVLSERQGSVKVGFIAPPLGPMTPPGPSGSPCPPDYVPDETGHCVYAPELPWPMMGSSAPSRRSAHGG